MNKRDEAIQKLKSLWGVTEFTFLARFDVPISQKEIDEPNAFGFFKEIYWNKKRLFFPSEEDSIKRNFASCYAKKQGLKHNSYYIITAKLSPDDKRKKNLYALTLTNAKDATKEEIDQHRSDFEKKESVFLATVNFVAADKSHAFVKIVDGLNTKSIKNAIGEKGEVMYHFPEKISKGQIVLVKKTQRKQTVTFVSDIFKGTLCNSKTFLDLDTFSGSLGLLASSSKGFNNDELETYNSRIKCAVNIYDSSPGFSIERIESEEELNLYDVEEFVNQIIHELFNFDLEEIDFRNRIKFLEKVDADFKNKISDVFYQDWKIISSDSDEDSISKFLLKWTKKYPEIVIFSNFRSNEYSRLFMKMWKVNKFPINFFEDQLFNRILGYITSYKITYKQFLQSLDYTVYELLKTKYLALIKTNISVDSFKEYLIIESFLNEFGFTEDQKKNALKVLNSAITKELQFEIWKHNKSDTFPIDIAISNFKDLDEMHQEYVVFRLCDENIIHLLGQINKDEFINKKINDLFKLGRPDVDFTNRIKLLEKVDAEFKNKVSEFFKFQWKRIKSQSEEALLIKFLQSWTVKYPEIVLLSNVGESKHNLFFMKLWIENQLPIDFFEGQLFNRITGYIASEKITDQEFLLGLDHTVYELLKTKYLALLKTNISIDSFKVYIIIESFLNQFGFTEVQKKMH